MRSSATDPLPEPGELLSLAEQAAMRAGEILLDMFGSRPRGLSSKSSSTDMVSDADRLAERAILDTIWQVRPYDSVLAEEGGDRPGPASQREGTLRDGRVRWIVDPLDGTTNWLHGLPAWAVSIAVEVAGAGVVGVVYAPLVEELFSVAGDMGPGPRSVPLGVRSPDSPGAAGLPLVATGFSYDPSVRAVQGALVGRVLPRIRDIRREGSAALDLAHVAAGRLDAFFEAPLAPWDTAAGCILVQEAGGIVVPLTLDGVAGEGVVAASGPELASSLCRLISGS